MTAVVTAAYTTAAQYPLNHARIGWQSWVQARPSASATATSAQSGHPASAAITEATFEGWRPVGSGSWTIDLGAARSADYVGIMGLIDGVTITVEYSPDNAAWTLFSQSSAITGNSAMFLDAQVSARYWRITVSQEATVSVVYIGQALEMMRPFFDGHSPINLSRTTDTRASLSRGGQFIGQDIVKQGYQGSMAWNNLTPGWYRENFDPLVKHLRNHPIFAAWNIAKYPEDVVYVWSGDDVSPAQQAITPGGRYNVSLSLTGVGNE